MTIHIVKCADENFVHSWDNRKPFEIRKLDRDYKRGDTILLREVTELLTYTGRWLTFPIIYVMANAVRYGVVEGVGVLGLGSNISRGETDDLVWAMIRSGGDITYPVNDVMPENRAA